MSTGIHRQPVGFHTTVRGGKASNYMREHSEGLRISGAVNVAPPTDVVVRAE